MLTTPHLRHPARRIGLAGILGTAIAALIIDGGPIASSAGAPEARDACGPLLVKPDGTTWSCSFVDDFGGTSLDSTKWITQDTGRTGFRTGLTCYRSSAANIAEREGVLRLTARRLRPFTCTSPLGDFVTRYTGGMVGTRGHFSQAYGRFEVRAKYPTERTSGLHGGFWMYPRYHAYGPWPASGEIDVAEWWSSDPTLVLPSLHYMGRDYRVDSGWGCRVGEPSRFHTYTLEWTPAVLRFLVDGTECFARTPDPDAPLVAPQPFDQPFSMILNLGVGAAGGTNKVTWQTSFPASYVVDYAKAWR